MSPRSRIRCQLRVSYMAKQSRPVHRPPRKSNPHKLVWLNTNRLQSLSGDVLQSKLKSSNGVVSFWSENAIHWNWPVTGMDKRLPMNWSLGNDTICICCNSCGTQTTALLWVDLSMGFCTDRGRWSTLTAPPAMYSGDQVRDPQRVCDTNRSRPLYAPLCHIHTYKSWGPFFANHAPQGNQKAHPLYDGRCASGSIGCRYPFSLQKIHSGTYFPNESDTVWHTKRHPSRVFHVAILRANGMIRRCRTFDFLCRRLWCHFCTPASMGNMVFTWINRALMSQDLTWMPGPGSSRLTVNIPRSTPSANTHSGL